MKIRFSGLLLFITATAFLMLEEMWAPAGAPKQEACPSCIYTSVVEVITACLVLAVHSCGS